jgi:integrase
MQGKITKRLVDALVPGNTDLFLWDTDARGFGLKLTPAGKKIYLLQYRTPGQRTPKRFTIGTHGSPWTPEMARKEAERILGSVAHGVDPAADRARTKEAPTVTEIAERFMEEHVLAKRKPRTGAEYQAIIRRIIIPTLGKKKCRDVNGTDISRLHHSLRSTPYMANRAIAVLSKMFNKAESWRERPALSNPCRGIEKFKEAKRERFLSPDELGRLGDALNSFDGSPYITAAIRILIFTGARLNEVLTLRWEWIDFSRQEIRLPDSKTGAKTIHLPPPALNVLSTLPRMEGNPHVICGLVPGACLVNLEKPWRKIRKEAGIADVRLHDLRHSFASVAASSGMGLPIIGKMLGHTQAQTTARYAHLADDPVKAAVAAVAGNIAAAMQGKAGELVPIRRSKNA